jgi:hypothetical protein
MSLFDFGDDFVFQMRKDVSCEQNQDQRFLFQHQHFEKKKGEKKQVTETEAEIETVCESETVKEKEIEERDSPKEKDELTNDPLSSPKPIANPHNKRMVYCGDAVEWLRIATNKWQNNPPASKISVITSLPDFAEVRMEIKEWKAWFHDVCVLIFRFLDSVNGSCAIFSQTDVRVITHTYPNLQSHQSTSISEYIPKTFLVLTAAVTCGWTLVSQQIMLIGDCVGQLKCGKKAAYTTLTTFTKSTIPLQLLGADVQERGPTLWTKGMGLRTTTEAVHFAVRMGSEMIVAPFAGKGTVLAVAEDFGVTAVGIELSQKKAKNCLGVGVGKSVMPWYEKRLKRWQRERNKVDPKEGKEEIMGRRRERTEEENEEKVI